MPYLAMWFMTFVFSFGSDYFINKQCISVTAARKLANTIGMLKKKIFIYVS